MQEILRANTAEDRFDAIGTLDALPDVLDNALGVLSTYSTCTDTRGFKMNATGFIEDAEGPNGGWHWAEE